MNHELIAILKALRLQYAASNYPEFSKQAEKKNATYETFLLNLMTGELAVKTKLKVDAIKRKAKMPTSKAIETYEHQENNGITPAQLRKLLTGQFLREAGNVVFFGPCGVGKTHLAIAITNKLCELGHKCLFKTTAKLIAELTEAQKSQKLIALYKRLDVFDLIVLDELGYVPTDQDGATLLFQLIADRSERKSLMITTNLVYSEWNTIFGSNIMTSAAVDRIIFNCETYTITGESWRQKRAKNKTST
jgi:DNA replication protein DnaC